MDWKLIFLLSGFGLAMAVATVFVIPPNIEPAFWLVIFLVCAYLIARSRSGVAPQRLFLHGLCVSLVNSVWITAAHVLLFDQYMASHPQEAGMMTSMPGSPKLLMVLFGPIVGSISGLVLGLFAWVAGKVVKPAPAR
ncbi:MAG TPA: hypothetical protein VNY05_41820 [Candidatus Acidoferrales bacterium]|nr:hypothetical protein [Candidatus Acidoferrales bacterium]